MPGLAIVIQTILNIKPTIKIEITCFDNDVNMQTYTQETAFPELRSKFGNIQLTYVDSFISTKGKFDIVYLEHPLALTIENWTPHSYRLLFPCLMDALQNHVMFINCNFFNAERNSTYALIKNMLPASAKKSFLRDPGSLNFFSLEQYSSLSTVSIQGTHSGQSQAMQRLTIDIMRYDELKKFLLVITIIFFIFSPSKTESWTNFISFVTQSATFYFQIFLPGVRAKDIIYDFLLFLFQASIFLIATGSLTSLMIEE